MCSPSSCAGHGSGSVGEAVEGVGGVFFRAHDPVALRAWYVEHLGIDLEEYGTTFTSKDGDQTVWASDLERNRFDLREPS